MIVSLQYLRALAALMVVWVHTATQWERLSGTVLPDVINRFGSAGVDIFFVISGVVMWVTTQGRDVTPLAFMRKRIIRIAPIYWVLTLLVAGVAVVAPRLLSSTVFDPAHLLASLFFVAWPHPALGTHWPVLIPGWTLNFEMMFYVLFALALWLPARWRMGAVLTALLALTLSGWLFQPVGALRFYTDPIILLFGAGILVGALVTGPVRLQAASGAIVFLAGWSALFGLVSSDLPGVLRAGLPAAMIVCGAVVFEKARAVSERPLLRHLGDASYSVYLTHILTLPIIAKAWQLGGLPVTNGSLPAFVLICSAASLAGGSLAYLLLERRLNAAAARLWPERRKIPARA